MGWEILLGTQNTLFENGNISQPRRGMTAVMIHELGHSLGLPHPHSNYGWGSAFINDVMSYFALDYNFSIFYRDALGRAHTDAHHTYAKQELIQVKALYETMTTSLDLDANFTLIENIINSIPSYYQQMNYTIAATLSIYARNLIKDVLDSLVNH